MVFRYVNTRYPLHQLRNEMDRLFDGLVSRAPGGLWPALGRGQPTVNLWEQGDQLIAEMELPGLKGDQIDIAVNGGELSIKVSYPEDTAEGVVYHRHERSRGAVERVLRLPADVDANRVEARLDNGVLTVTLPKSASAKPRKISVASG